MTVALGLPTGYPWVLALTTGSIFLNIWQSTLVSAARKKAGIKYPQMYASKEEEARSKEAKIFNCTQRAHQNTLESAHHFILLTLIAGFRYPRVAVGLASLNLIGRVMYTLGE
jgi:glutathione S-transferase